MVFAGLDTTTSALARCIYLLAQHSGAQARLRNEIRNATKILEEDGDMSSVELPYDVLMNLPFLDGVVKETLRLYPSLPVMARVYVSFPFYNENSLHACRIGQSVKSNHPPFSIPYALTVWWIHVRRRDPRGHLDNHLHPCCESPQRDVGC